jgi:RNA polymerase sigma-54 factor
MTSQELGFALRPEQRMMMLPRMLQALDVLQLPRPALGELLQSVVANNEALRWTRRRGRTRVARENTPDVLERIPASRGSLKLHLMQQIAEVDCPPRVRALAEMVVDSLDERGLRTIDDIQLARIADPSATPAEMAACDALLQQLDPAGSGARDAVEAMTWQVPAGDPDRATIATILRTHLEELAKHRHDSVAQSLKISIEELHGLLAKIRRLQSRPANGFETDTAAPVRPDVILRRTATGFELECRGAGRERVELADDIVMKSKDPSIPPEVRSYYRARVEAAKTILASLEQRGRTLEKVCRALFRRQMAFVENGPRWIRSLQMQELAGALSLHPSTVSRAVAGKYVETQWGIFKLRDFFVVGVELSTGGVTTRDELRDAIRAIFAGENPADPLDDDSVVAQLQKKGFRVARRTVAKYRSELGIPSSWHRRRPADHTIASTAV